ncbi:MAG: hypothetical protein GX610_21490 [Rhodococcus sp.]|nr:hypothetical protein [Rhodococcus sp. (in: high G+C Gram-positive bacteria)]
MNDSADFESDTFDLDTSVNHAWADFQLRLADHIAMMQQDDLLILEAGFGAVDAQRSMPYVQYLVSEGNMVRCEVPSNDLLHPDRALSDSDQTYLTELGWARPTHGLEVDDHTGSSSFFVDKSQSWSDQLAAMTVAAFRDVWGVTHPAFLESVESGNDDVPSFEAVEPADSLVPPMSPITPVVPHDSAHLKALVSRALVSLLGVAPQQDPDGDIPVRVGNTIMFVGQLADTLDIQLFAPLVNNISDRTRACELVADLNRKWLRIKFVLVDDRLSGFVELPGNPFVPQHLTDLCGTFTQFLKTIDQSFAAKFGGELFFDRSASSSTDVDLTAEEIPAELKTLLHLDPRGDGTLDTAVVAEVCGHDRSRILQLLNLAHLWQSQLQQSSKLAAEDEDLSMRDAFEAQAASWRSMMDLLRGALRTVVIPTDTTESESTAHDEPAEPPTDPGEPTLFDEL